MPGAEPFALVYAATAWHWVDPAVRYRPGGRRPCDPGGHLAFWEAVHVFPLDGDPFFEELQDVYDEIGESLPPDVPRPRPQELDDKRAEIEASGLFEVVDIVQYDWEQVYDAEGYIDLLNTFSGHIAMEDWQRDRLYGEIRRRLTRPARRAPAPPLGRRPPRRPAPRRGAGCLGWPGWPAAAIPSRAERGAQPLDAAGPRRHRPRLRPAAGRPGAGPDRAASPRRTSSAPSGPRSARRRTATCSAGGSSGRCPCCATPTAASPTSASRSASPAWAPSAGRSATSWGESPRRSAGTAASRPGADVLRHERGRDRAVSEKHAVPGACVASPPCSTASATPASTSSTRTRPSTSTSASSASRSAPTSTSASCAGSPSTSPANPDRHILLEKPGPPPMSDEVAAAGPRPGHQGRDRAFAHPHHRRLPQDLREAQGQGRRVHSTSRPSSPTASTAASATRSATSPSAQPAPGTGEITDEVKQRWDEEKPDPSASSAPPRQDRGQSAPCAWGSPITSAGPWP